MFRFLLLALAAVASGFQLSAPVARPFAQPDAHAVARVQGAPQMVDFDMNTAIAIGTLVLSVGGGVGLIAFTENAGKRNEEMSNVQPCFDCKGKKVTTCTICQGSGSDPYASLVAGVREMAGEEDGSGKIVVEDWASGPREVVMYEEILSKYPPKDAESPCSACSARGIVVCDNCQGSGIQPRFLERYSPDDFMD